MIKIEHEEDCCGCSACVNACPKQCITMVNDCKGFAYPNVNTVICVDCKFCEKVCPLLRKYNQCLPLQIVGARSLSSSEVLMSSSGAVVHELALHFIKELSGIVNGAQLQQDLTVHHARITEPKELGSIRGSKYLPSNLGKIPLQVKSDLIRGHQVLFIGTPCQVAGLKGFLGKSYENLATVDFVCHGVPSQAVFNESVSLIEKQKRQKVVKVNFRSKPENWRNFNTEYTFENGDSYYIEHSKSFFFRGFMSDLYLRESCHQCRFANHYSQADITVADLWGIEYTMPECDDNTGLNLVMIRTIHGKQLWNALTPRLQQFDYKLEEAVKYNPAIVSPPQKHRMSPIFWKCFTMLPIKINIFLSLVSGRILRYLKNNRWIV